MNGGRAGQRQHERHEGEIGHRRTEVILLE
jgi:hypothetical protein